MALLKVFKMKMLRYKKKVIFGSVVLLGVLYTFLFLTPKKETVYPDQRKTYLEVQKRFFELIKYEKNTGCQMPYLDPFAPELTKHDRPVDDIVCEGEEWVVCFLSECHPTEEILKKMRDLTCVYHDIMFFDDDHYYFGEPVSVIGSSGYVLSRSDFVKVSCSGVNVDSIGLLKQRWFGYLAGYRPVQHPKVPSADSPNILLLLFDSTSRNHFIRRMPVSYGVLTKELKAVVLNSYNIVGESTVGALLPILTGFEELELKVDSRKTPTNTQKVDLTPFIFTLLKNEGYHTAYYEDMPWIGTFNYRFNGFPSPPADHYMRPYFQAEGHNIVLKWWDGLKRRYCIGGVSLFNFMMNYTSRLFDLPGKKYCVSFSATYSHNDINLITAVDLELAEFLRRFKRDGKLEDTMLLVIGDHGSRFAEQRETYQGKIEERLPFASVVLPEKLKRSRPDAFDNLKANAEVLVTPFDLHTTVLDALGLSAHRNTYILPGADLERGLSILDPIPKTRSCAEAGVMPHWCACTKWHNVSVDEDVYKKVASVLSDYINSITEEKRDQCAVRKLVEIEWVQQLAPNKDMLGFDVVDVIDRYLGRYLSRKHKRPATEFFQAKIILSPGRGIYEGSMEYIVKDDLFLISDRDISRVNRYGDEPDCISRTHPHLNKFCYCSNKLGYSTVNVSL